MMRDISPPLRRAVGASPPQGGDASGPAKPVPPHPCVETLRSGGWRTPALQEPLLPSDQLLFGVGDLAQRLVARATAQQRHFGVGAVPGRVLDAVEHLAQ